MMSSVTVYNSDIMLQRHISSVGLLKVKVNFPLMIKQRFMLW